MGLVSKSSTYFFIGLLSISIPMLATGKEDEPKAYDEIYEESGEPRYEYKGFVELWKQLSKKALHY